jgi:hypothetical protein
MTVGVGWRCTMGTKKLLERQQITLETKHK